MADANPLTKEIRILASELGARLFRQNTGMAWIGKARRIARHQSVPVGPGDVIIKSARPFHAGLKGMSDLGGWMPVEITPEMVGKTVAVYTQVEVKTTDKPSPEQLHWIEMVRDAGGIADVVRNLDGLRRMLTSGAQIQDR
ncbi:VRR-NUC domain-containing protein [Breoghania sp.]|uniref:VRR-NUC domain-containing protein n=1 Tax=Breoghania sp. TaxID=2065378 RepID=UPI002AA7EF2C|nr:VRR-NUC domain-containing protein [Breoghania sp.]